MKMFLLVLFFGMMASANELNVKFGIGGEGTSKTFKIDDESPGFMSKGGKILCGVSYMKKGKKFSVSCEGGKMRASMIIKCNGEAQTVFFNVNDEKEDFQVTSVCMGPEKT